MGLHSSAFGNDFTWGVASSAYQTEGAYLDDGKGLSIWDVFTERRGKVPLGQHGKCATNFYQRYIQDVILMEYLGIRHFRFSLSWSRLFPDGTGTPNPKGVAFYNELIDFCLACGVQPWVTLYHWDLPQALEEKGGWANRQIVQWFEDYVTFCVKQFGDRVKHWMVMNEPMAFTGAGYFLGIHAPGRKGLTNFLPAVHHAALCQSGGISLIKSLDPTAQVGTTFSCAQVDPVDDSRPALEAAQRVDVLTNRLFAEPLLGLGYPVQEMKVLQNIEKYMLPGDAQRLQANPDFIGLQNYTREVVRHSTLMPYLNARLVKASKRGVPRTAMDWEIYPAGIYKILKRFATYPGVKGLIITENGAAFNDVVSADGHVHDEARIHFYQQYLQQVLKAKEEGVPVHGYFAWSFTDNFEWAEGYSKRFGLVYIDYATQKRIIKDSGFWYQRFLEPVQPYPLARATLGAIAGGEVNIPVPVSGQVV